MAMISHEWTLKLLCQEFIHLSFKWFRLRLKSYNFVFSRQYLSLKSKLHKLLKLSNLCILFKWHNQIFNIKTSTFNQSIVRSLSGICPHIEFSQIAWACWACNLKIFTNSLIIRKLNTWSNLLNQYNFWIILCG